MAVGAVIAGPTGACTVGGPSGPPSTFGGPGGSPNPTAAEDGADTDSASGEASGSGSGTTSNPTTSGSLDDTSAGSASDSSPGATSDGESGESGESGTAPLCPPQAGDDACFVCGRQQCCPQIQTCQADPICSCSLDCIAVGGDPDVCSMDCGGSNVPSVALIGCVYVQCPICDA